MSWNDKTTEEVHYVVGLHVQRVTKKSKLVGDIRTAQAATERVVEEIANATFTDDQLNVALQRTSNVLDGLYVPNPLDDLDVNLNPPQTFPTQAFPATFFPSGAADHLIESDADSVLGGNNE